MTTRTGAHPQQAEALAGPAPPQAVPAAAVAPGEDERFDRLIYGRVRLGILSALAVNQQLHVQ